MSLRRRVTLASLCSVPMIWLIYPRSPLQLDPRWIYWSGWLCLLIMMTAWSLPLKRWLATEAEGDKRLHSQLGLALIIPLSVHALSDRFSWLYVLALLLLCVSLLGLYSPSELSSALYRKLWWWLHILLAGVTSTWVLLHIWSIMAYS